MKNLLFLFLLTLVANFGYAQNVPEKANTAVITFASAEEAEDKLQKAFKKMGYDVKPDKKNKALRVTDLKTIKNNTRVFFTTEVNGAEVILTGMISVAGQGNMPIEFKGKKGTAIMNAWEEMEKVVKALGGTAVFEVR
ncbi:MAG: hypothetical protein ACK4ND_12410 [Cytophagaceae bacterium]